jgi:hypothetical protein
MKDVTSQDIPALLACIDEKPTPLGTISRFEKRARAAALRGNAQEFWL